MATDEESIRGVIDRWHAATAAGDVDGVLRLMAEDVVFLVPGRPPMTGRSGFEKGLRQLLDSHRIESTGDVREIEVSGDLAYCLNWLTVRISPLSGGEPSVRSGHSLSVFRKQPDGSWVLSLDANLLQL